MTLTEALKSGRRIRDLNARPLALREWFEPRKNEMYWLNSDVISESWEVEPEPLKPVTFECKWIGWPDGPVYPMVEKDLSFLLGKRTKVTIEVIE